MKTHEAMNYFLLMLCDVQPGSAELSGLANERALKKVQAFYDGHGRGEVPPDLVPRAF